MSSTSEPTQFEPEPSSQRTIKPRGKACLHCRRRKMRCDGVRPSCNQCVRADRAGECEYADGESKTGTQLLYERLAELEKRYRELQSRRPAASAQRNISGSDDGLSRNNSGRSRGGTRGGRHGYTFNNYGTDGESGIVPLDSILQVGSPVPANPTLPNPESSITRRSVTHTEGSQHARFSTPPFEVGFSYSDPRTVHNPAVGQGSISVAPERSLSPISSFDINDLSPLVLDHLIQCFLAHSQQAGVSPLIEDKNILEAMRGQSNNVMACVYLWGAHFSPNKSYQAFKEPLLKLALSSLPQLLQEPLGSLMNYPARSRPKFRGALALSSMLALYFFANGRMLEGSYHSNLAVHLSICAGLPHTPDLQAWRSGASGISMREFEAGSSLGTNRLPENATDLLPYPTTEVEVLDLHYVLWNIFVLDRSWSAACGFPSSTRWGSAFGGNSSSAISEQSLKDTIVTSWPQDRGLLLLKDDTDGDMVHYPQSLSVSTIDNFLMGIDLRPTTSILQIRAKSAALFEAAARLSTSCDENVTLDSVIETLRRTIDVFLSMLPPYANYSPNTPSSYSKSSLFTCHSMAHAAVIRLEFRIADMGYEKGIYNSPMNHLHSAGFREERGVEVVRDTLLGYERLHSNYVASGYQGQQDAAKMGEWVLATQTGVISAAVDKCLLSAKYIANLVGCINPEDYLFLEPIVSPCWELAGQVLLRELRRLNFISAQQPEKKNVITDIQTLINGLLYIGNIFPIGNIHAQNISNGLQGLILATNTI